MGVTLGKSCCIFDFLNVYLADHSYFPLVVTDVLLYIFQVTFRLLEAEKRKLTVLQKELAQYDEKEPQGLIRVLILNFNHVYIEFYDSNSIFRSPSLHVFVY